MTPTLKYALYGYLAPVLAAVTAPELWLHLNGYLPQWYLPLVVVAAVALTRGDRRDFLRYFRCGRV